MSRKKSTVLRHQLRSPDTVSGPGALETGPFRSDGLSHEAQGSLGHSSLQEDGLKSRQPRGTREKLRVTGRMGAEHDFMSHHAIDKHGAIPRPQGAQTEAEGMWGK